MQVNSETALRNGRRLLAEHDNSWLKVLENTRRARKDGPHAPEADIREAAAS
jgi:hypothetical protein